VGLNGGLTYTVQVAAVTGAPDQPYGQHDHGDRRPLPPGHLPVHDPAAVGGLARPALGSHAGRAARLIDFGAGKVDSPRS
jgi:hypothetical protein